MKKTKKVLHVLNDNLIVGTVPAENPDGGAFLVSQEDTTFVGVIKVGGPKALLGVRFRVGDKVYFGKDYLQMNMEGVMVKIMPLSNIKAIVIEEVEDE